MKIKPSTLLALLNGDLENAVISATPGGIEAQEKQGQKNFINSTTLPKDIRGARNENPHVILANFGIVFGEDADDLFCYVSLPNGWKKVPTNHSMWSDLIDEKGRVRANIFYKAAFYDRSAHMHLCKRYSYQIRPVNGWEENYTKDEWCAVVTDGDKVIWKSESIDPEPPYDKSTNSTEWREWYDKKQELGNVAKARLDEIYPDWESSSAYWD